MNLEQLGAAAKQASFQIMNASTTSKNQVLTCIGEKLKANQDLIIEANQKDLANGKANGMNQGLLDRMLLDEKRINGIIEGVNQVIALNDPVGEISDMIVSKDGLHIGKMRVAIGVVGMIYEARPNVTVDAAILCLKSGNAVMLRGSKDIIESNKTIVKLMREALSECGFDSNIITLLEDTSHECANKFMQLNQYIDILIPRGSAKLIKTTVENASIPVLETGSGNCHIYIDEDADYKKILPIIVNAKTQRTSVCNACESLIVHKDVDRSMIRDIIDVLKSYNVKIHGDKSICALDDEVILATPQDWGKEYLDLEISIKMVETFEEAIQHINYYSTHHSETIITENYTKMLTFLRQIDSACVYVNASTRFSDGFEFGLGAEIGISTQKLHARGPMGLHALTTQKYIILGEGQIRE